MDHPQINQILDVRHPLKMYFLLKIGIFYCYVYVSLPECFHRVPSGIVECPQVDNIPKAAIDSSRVGVRKVMPFKAPKERKNG